MLKALAVVRTLFLVFIVGYTVRAMPWWTSVAHTFDEQYARCSETVGLLMRAAWFAIGWIAVETLVGWWLATRARRKPLEPDLPKPRTSEPPFAPPPR
jgi:hypothetical protein